MREEQDGESITRVQDTINRLNVELKEDQEYVDRQANDEGRKLLNNLADWMAKRVTEA